MLETTATAVQIGTNKNLSGYRAALFACFLCVGVLTQLRLVTRRQIDGLTDRRTHDDSIHHRAIIAHAVRSNKKWSKSKKLLYVATHSAFFFGLRRQSWAKPALCGRKDL